MDQNALSQQIIRFFKSPRKRKILLSGLILFALLSILLYTLSFTRGNLQASLLFSAALAFFVTKCLLAFATPWSELTEPGIAWDKQPHIMKGIFYFGLTLISLVVIVNLFIANGLLDSITTVVACIGLVFVLFGSLRESILRRAEARSPQSKAKAEAKKAAKAEKKKAAEED